ncbi:MAG: RsmB/NOP family class I SAM-dependent RNA methyltransferase [bacterium]
MSRFRTYLENTFHLTSTELEDVMSSLVKPLTKSIRINTHKISREDFILHAREQNWVLTETDIPEVFLIDREDTSLALGRTLEHQAGWFYIQELAAAHPPFLLKREIVQNTKDKIQNRESVGSGNKINEQNQPNQPNFSGTIIDMCASPGGKTTQLADYFPESLIIANEVNRSRTPQLFDNLDRMGYDNVAVVSCDGRFFQNFPEYFDAVLLDAPCSGEGTVFRDSSVIEHWHEKNIHRIAKLQKQLFETAMTIVKPGGFISYSTCTLNKEENENVILLSEGIQNTKDKEQKNGGLFQCLYQKRFWPHIEHTGGFFASIFQKRLYATASHEYPLLPSQGQTPFVRPATKGERETVERFVMKHLHTKLADRYLFISKDGVYANPHNL